MYRRLLQFTEGIRMALDALWSNKFRSFLSVLGITIGIFTIIAVYTASDSLERNIRKSIESMGEEVIVVQKWPWAFGSDYAWWDYMKRPEPDYKEYQQLVRTMDTEKRGMHAFSVRKSGVSIKAGNQEADMSTMVGVSADFFYLMGESLYEGHFLTDFECDKGKNAAVIGYTLYQNLFPEGRALGKTIRADGRKLYVAGILQEKGSSLGGPSLDNAVIVPYHFLKTSLNTQEMGRYNPQMLIKGQEGIELIAMEQEVKRAMRNVRKLKPREKDNFALNKMTMLTTQLESTFGIINVVITIIGMFSLLVGGFGIANIMFVSVKERTHLIGIQKALGASEGFILVQFLSEAVLLCIAGGLIGMGLVALIAWGVNSQTDFSIYLSLKNFLQGAGISSLIGLLAGFIPAKQAARLEPVDAMRSK